MMRLSKLKNSMLLLIAVISMNIGCNKQLDIASTSVANQQNVWKTLEDARSGVMGMYGLLRAALAADNAHWLRGELRNGIFVSTSRPDLKAIIDGNLNAGYPIMKDATDWRRFYALINACNVLLENIENCRADTRYTRAYYNVDVAQARALRAFAYFYISRIWGDVPLITSSGEKDNFKAVSRTDKVTVLDFAERELLAVVSDLPFTYSGDDPEFKFPQNYYGANEDFWSNAPITRVAAYAILAHVTAWQGKYADVAAYTEFVVANATRAGLTVATTDQLVGSGASGVFSSSLGNYRQLFSARFLKTTAEFTVDGHIEQLTLANTTAFSMSKQLPDIYVPKIKINEIFSEEPGDQLKDERFLDDTYFENYDAEIPVFKKIRVIDEGIANPNYIIYNSALVFTRLEDIKLLRAEALAVLGLYDDAYAELNGIRSARGLAPISSAMPNKNTLLKQIQAERTKELMGEGWHWYDLIRFAKIFRDDPEMNLLIDQGGIYWPVSKEVLNSNSQIQQTPYWQ
ncbi:MAG: RagB/SusD family nutrient uptake outer membrane protein [Niabella sp.]